MLTMILLGTTIGLACTTYKATKALFRARRQLRKFAVSDDGDILGVLEMTDTPLAKKLLAAAQEEPEKENSGDALWDAFWFDFTSTDYYVDMDNVLKRYIKDGLRVTEQQRRRVLRRLNDDSFYRDAASKKLLKALRK
jgi:hypothetical protein